MTLESFANKAMVAGTLAVPLSLWGAATLNEPKLAIVGTGAGLASIGTRYLATKGSTVGWLGATAIFGSVALAHAAVYPGTGAITKVLTEELNISSRLVSDAMQSTNPIREAVATAHADYKAGRQPVIAVPALVNA